MAEMVPLQGRLSLGLIGYPLDKSLSPLLHSAGLNGLGLDGEYRLYRTPPLPEGQAELAARIAQVRAGAVQGLNVTIPHKISVIPLLDELSEVARSIGAVNTIYLQDGRVFGDNTDAAGFLTDALCQAGFTRPGVGLVLGAGGAARAATYALWSSGWQVIVASRRPEQARDLVASFVNGEAGEEDVAARNEAALLRPLRPDKTPADLAMKALSATLISPDLSGLLQRTSADPSLPLLIVNASSAGMLGNIPAIAGMLPNIDESPWPEETPFPPGAFVYDLVYKPLETRLMREARQSGLRVANGLGMLVEQAALALERWTGRDVPRRVMWQALIEKGVIPDFPESMINSPSIDPYMRNESV